MKQEPKVINILANGERVSRGKLFQATTQCMNRY